MKFVVSSSLLLKNLKNIGGVVASNPVVPILENILFDVYDNVLSATASDMQSSVKTSIDVEADGNGMVAVPAKKLLETLANLPEQPITITVDEDTYAVEIQSDNGYYKLSGENAVDFPKMPEVNNAFSIEFASSALLRTINFTLFATSTDDMRPAMGGIYFQLKADKGVFAATDGHRLVRYTRTDISSANETAILLPRKAMSLLKSMLVDDDTVVTVNFNQTNAHFEFNNMQMICRLLDERYPDYENAIPLNNINVMTIGRQDLMNSLKRISIYSNKVTNQVRFKIGDDQLHISAEDLDFSNEANETLPCEYEGKQLEIGFNSRFFSEILANLDTNLIDLELSEPNKAGLIIPKTMKENEDLLMLVMPVMLNQYA
jgi:DNA polymerase-3 subunit beta